jgi:hypothetical protein
MHVALLHAEHFRTNETVTLSQYLTKDAVLVGPVGTKIQDQHSVQRNKSCKNPMHAAYIIVDES